MSWSHLRTGLLIVTLGLSFIVQGASAATSTPNTVDSNTEMVTTDGCMRTYVQIILDRNGLESVPGVWLYIVVDQTNTCTGEHLLQLSGGDYHTDLSFDTYGADVNTVVRATDFAQNVAGKQYDVWINYRIKCTQINQRYHPGVDCDGTIVGHIAFGKWDVAAPAGNLSGIGWR